MASEADPPPLRFRSGVMDIGRWPSTCTLRPKVSTVPRCGSITCRSAGEQRAELQFRHGVAEKLASVGIVHRHEPFGFLHEQLDTGFGGYEDTDGGISLGKSSKKNEAACHAARDCRTLRRS